MIGTMCRGQLSPTSSFKLYNTNHGLPSTQIQGLFEDSQHYIWAITDRGVARFDGYEFKVYTAQQGLPTNNVLLINEDKHGKIWFMCNTGEYCYLENDSIYPYSGNAKIKRLLKDRLPGPFYFDASDTLWVTTFSGIQLFKCFGDSVSEFKPLAVEGATPATYYLRRVGDKLLTLQVGKTHDNDGITTPDRINYLLTLAGECKLACSVRVDEKKWAVAGPGGYVVFDETGTIITHYTSSPYIFSTLEHDRMGRLWLTNSNGAYLLNNYTDGPSSSTPYFEGHFISAMLQDRQGNYWFGDRDNGIFFVPDLGVKVLREPMVGKQNKIVSIQSHDQQIYYSDAGGKIYLYADSGAVLIGKEGVPSGVSLDFGILSEGGFIAGNKPHLISGRGEIKMAIETNSTVRKITKLRDGRLMMALSDGLACYQNGTWQPIWPDRFKERCNAIYERSDGSIWVATNSGVFSYQGDSIQPIAAIVKEKLRVVDILEWNHLMLFATRQQGLAIWNGERLQYMTEAQGLLSSTVDCLLRDPNGDLWIGTSLGLQCLRWDPANSSFVSIHIINTDKGLPSNEINDLFMHGQTMLVATNDGLAVIYQPWFTRASADPIVGITAVRVVDSNRPLGQPMELEYDENQVRFSFLSFNFRMANHSRYRYRLIGLHEDWKETGNTSAEYWSLRPGQYQFEVQSMNEDGKWSASSAVNFTIHPHFSQTWWFRIGLSFVILLLVIGGAWWWHTSRQRRLLQRAKMAELRQQALNANMNPHFIFNALNSIQHLVLKQQTLEANEYLTDFSKLIRMNLEANTQQWIPLNEELEKLELYLKLEQLRFGDLLRYSIENNSSMYLGSLEIPPMFLQPYVENSILHGILPSGRAGTVVIRCTDLGVYYSVEIIDNGIGLKAASQKERPGHHSLATDMNNDRLVILREITGQRCECTRDEQFDDEGNSLGTSVKVLFPKQILA
jgi:ligand-binding sensor domain-containing protein